MDRIRIIGMALHYGLLIEMPNTNEIPDDIRFLTLLHNIGAISPERSLSIEEISRWAAIGPHEVREKLLKLSSKRYVDFCISGNVRRYYVTVEGMRKVLSTYS